MPKNSTFHRIKAAVTTAVTNAIRWRIAEGPNALAAPNPDTGTDGILTARPQYNSDGAGAYVGLFEVTATVAITDDNNVGPASLIVTLTPVKGDGTLHTAAKQTITFAHTQSMDAWLTAAGIARG